jgi:hypothetical protein
VRTTIDIEDDILAAVKEMARREKVSAGRILSRLAREALTRCASPEQPESGSSKGRSVGGFRPFSSRGEVVTNEYIDRLRDQENV